jgi:hypothetical protein
MQSTYDLQDSADVNFLRSSKMLVVLRIFRSCVFLMILFATLTLSIVAQAQGTSATDNVVHRVEVDGRKDVNAYRLVYSGSFKDFNPGFLSRGQVIFSTKALPPSDKNSSTSDCGESPATSMPVVIATGEKFLSHSDFDHQSLASLALNRTYRSQQNNGNLFGSRWAASLDYPKMEYAPQCSVYPGRSHLGCLPDWIKIKFPDGAVYSFKMSSPEVYFPVGATDGSGAMGMILTVANPFKLSIGTKTYNYNVYSKLIESIEEKR